MSYLENALEVEGLHSPSVVKSQRLHLSSRKKPVICGCLWEVFQHRQSTTRKRVNRTKDWEVTWCKAERLVFLSIAWCHSCSKHSNGFPSHLTEKPRPSHPWGSEDWVPALPLTWSYTTAAVSHLFFYLRNVLSPVILGLWSHITSSETSSNHPQLTYYIFISLLSFCPTKM